MHVPGSQYNASAGAGQSTADAHLASRRMVVLLGSSWTEAAPCTNGADHACGVVATPSTLAVLELVGAAASVTAATPAFRRPKSSVIAFVVVGGENGSCQQQVAGTQHPGPHKPCVHAVSQTGKMTRTCCSPPGPPGQYTVMPGAMHSCAHLLLAHSVSRQCWP